MKSACCPNRCNSSWVQILVGLGAKIQCATLQPLMRARQSAKAQIIAAVLFTILMAAATKSMDPWKHAYRFLIRMTATPTVQVSLVLQKTHVPFSYITTQ